MQQLRVPEPHHELGQRFQIEGGLIHIEDLDYLRQDAPPEPVGVQEHARQLFQLSPGSSINILGWRQRSFLLAPAGGPLGGRGLQEVSLGIPEAAGEGGDHEAEATLYLVDPGGEVAGRARPGEDERERAAGLVGGRVEEGAEEGGEHGGVEVAEPEEGGLEWIAPVGREELGNVVVGGEIKGLEVGLEVGVEGVDVGGKEVGGGDHGAAEEAAEGNGVVEAGDRHGVPEEGEEGRPEGVDPLGVEVLEGAGALLAANATGGGEESGVRVRVGIGRVSWIGEEMAGEEVARGSHHSAPGLVGKGGGRKRRGGVS